MCAVSALAMCASSAVVGAVVSRLPYAKLFHNVTASPTRKPLEALSAATAPRYPRSHPIVIDVDVHGTLRSHNQRWLRPVRLSRPVRWMRPAYPSTRTETQGSARGTSRYKDSDGPVPRTLAACSTNSSTGPDLELDLDDHERASAELERQVRMVLSPEQLARLDAPVPMIPSVQKLLDESRAARASSKAAIRTAAQALQALMASRAETQAAMSSLKAKAARVGDGISSTHSSMFRMHSEFARYRRGCNHDDDDVEQVPSPLFW